jgi:hypothetical protein
MSVALFLLAAAVSCPPFIQTKQELLDSHTGWQAEVTKPEPKLRLSDAALFFGHPSRLEVLVPRETKNGLEWHESRGEHWIECTYNQTTLRLVKRIDGPVDCIAKAGQPLTNRPASMECAKRPK